MPTKKQIDDHFDELHKYFRWLIRIGYYETWEVLSAALRIDHDYILRRKIK